MREINDDDLVAMGCRKDNLMRFVRKHFVAGRDYTFEEIPKERRVKRWGGHNTLRILVTEDTYGLIRSSYNLKNRYVPSVGSLTQVKTIMSLENQTIGFICSSLQGLALFERQFLIGPYKVDVCFTDFCLVVECDELGHKDRDIDYERERESYIGQAGFRIIRFNPNAEDFDLSIVLRQVICIVRPL